MQTALLIFIVIFALAIGFFLGLLLVSLDLPMLKKLEKEEDEEPESQALPVDEMGKSEPEVALPPVQKPTPGSRLLLRVWKEEGKPPVYDLDGTYVEKEQLPRELLHVITVYEEVPQPEPDPTPPAENAETQPEPELDEELEGEIQMLSVIDEVNDILQKKLLGSPLAGKGIHLMENHNQEIRFWVGLESYSDVEEIPDPEVRRLIDEAVREWEANRG